MDSNEEYLDQLLKSLTEGTSSKTAEEADDSDQDAGLGDLLNQFSDDMDSVPQDLLSGLLGGTEESAPETQPGEEQGDVPPSDIIQDMAAQDSEEAAGTILPELAEETPQPPVFDTVVEPVLEPQEQSEEKLSELPVSELEEQSESDMAWETEFDMFKDPESDADEQAEPDAAESLEFDMAGQTEPDMPMQPEDSEPENDDLSSLLESLRAEGDEDIQEISELLDKAERDEPVEDMVDALMQELNEELSPDERHMRGDYSDDNQGLAEQPEQPARKRKRKERVRKQKVKKEKVKKEKVKKEKVKKEKVKKERKRWGRKKKDVQELVENLPEEAAERVEDGVELLQLEEPVSAEPMAAEKKPGFWSRLLDALTREAEEDEDPADLVSDENEAILKELDKEKKQAKGKKKKGKDKGKKAPEPGDDEELEEDADSKKKKKKEKKPKKEKPPVSVEDLLPGKKLPLKKVLSIVLVVLVFGFAYVLVSHLYIDHVNKQGAEKAYYAGDYLECYSLLLGQNRNDNQELMYHKSELVLQMERMKANYRRLVMEGKELEALDYLVQCVCRRESFYAQGQEWNSTDVVEETYTGMVGLLNVNYGLTEERAAQIAALKSDVDYTLALLEVLKERDSDPQEEEETPAVYEDLLPEEEENSDTAFVDTMG